MSAALVSTPILRSPEREWPGHEYGIKSVHIEFQQAQYDAGTLQRHVWTTLDGTVDVEPWLHTVFPWSETVRKYGRQS